MPRSIRTLIRAERIGLIIPAWDYSVLVPYAGRTDIPEAVIAGYHIGKIHSYARVNLEAEQIHDLQFSH